MPLPKKKSASKTSKSGAPGAKKAPVTKPGGGSKSKSAAKRTGANQKSAPGKRSSHGKADLDIPTPSDSKTETAEGSSRTGAKPGAKSVAKSGVAVKKKRQEAGLADSISQGLAKQGQKKRGWRDIEALTERARLKNLLSDIWHEDIDLDSDIFGETDQFSTYYTDKEVEIEVEDDEDEEWEEFEEDES